VPGLVTNLLSVSQIIKNGDQVKFYKSSCITAVLATTTIVATASLINNMYKLNMPENFACMSDVVEQDNLWH
jgi:hypothetical protein